MADKSSEQQNNESKFGKKSSVKAFEIGYESVSEALKIIENPSGVSTIPNSVMEFFDRAFTDLCEGDGVANISIFADCPCKLKATLAFGESQGGLGFNLHKCDLCDKKDADKQCERVGACVSTLLASWSHSEAGQGAVRGAIARGTGSKVGDIGIASTENEARLHELIQKQHSGLEALAKMLDFFLRKREIAQLDDRMFETMQQMAKTYGMIASDFNLGESEMVDEKKMKGLVKSALEDISEEDIVKMTKKIIDKSRESDGGTNESD